MASNNLRVIYDNLVDASTTTITVSSTASAQVTAANMKLDAKSLVWRSGVTGTTDTAKGNIIVTFPQQVVGGVILPFCNLSSVATIRVRGYTGIAPTHGGTLAAPTITPGTTTVFDTGTVMACPYQPLGLWNWGAYPLGVNSYSYGGGTYGRVWVPEQSQQAVSSLSIEIVDTANSSQYVEVSRLVIGYYWSPKYNTSFGLGNSIKDTSTHLRSESGNLITNRGTSYNTMNFDLKWMTPSDRLDLMRILKGNGLSKPLFISLFPDNSEDWAKEQTHQIYGKLSQLPGISHPVYEMYSSSIDFEEI